MRKALIGILFFLPSLAFGATYGSNVLVGGTGTCDGGGTCANAFDENQSTLFNGGTLTPPFNINYDLGVGNEKKIAKLTWVSYWDAGGGYVKDVKVQGSNNGSTYTDIATITIADGSPDKQNQTFEFSNDTSYRYYRFQTQNSYIAYANNITWDIYGYECISGCTASTTNTTSSIIGFMSPQLDFMLQLLVEAIFVIIGFVGGYLLIKKLTKK